jgi:hypothetical protein
MPANNKKDLNKAPIIPSIGAEVDQKFLKSFYPKPTKEMKWVYSMKLNIYGIDVNGELVMEVISIDGENVKIKTRMGEQSFENTVTLDNFAPVPSNSAENNATGFRYDGFEDIKVPYGSFPDAVKLSTSAAEDRSYLWLAPEVGPLKFGIKAGGVPATLELKEFKK